jgi:hypothetical protein
VETTKPIRRRRPTDPDKYIRPYQTRLYPHQIEAVKAVLSIERQRDPKITEVRVIRGLLKLGMVRYQELGRIPEVDG